MTISRRCQVTLGTAAIAVVLLAGCAPGTIAGTAGTASVPLSADPPSTTIRPTIRPTPRPPADDCVSNGPSAVAGPVPTPTGTPAITVTQGSNAWIANSSTEPYAIAVYANGTAIRAGANGAYSEALPELTIGRLDRCLFSGVVDDLRELANADLGHPQVTDQGTTEVTVSATGGPDLLISAYALGIGDEYVEPAQQAARQRFSTAIAALLDGVLDGRPWTAESLRVSSLGAPQGNLADRPAALNWPLEAGMAQTMTGGSTTAACGELAGQDAAAVQQVLAGQSSATMWTDGRQTLVLAIGVLVPGQRGCPAR